MSAGHRLLEAEKGREAGLCLCMLMSKWIAESQVSTLQEEGREAGQQGRAGVMRHVQLVCWLRSNQVYWQSGA